MIYYATCFFITLIFFRSLDLTALFSLPKPVFRQATTFLMVVAILFIRCSELALIWVLILGVILTFGGGKDLWGLKFRVAVRSVWSFELNRAYLPGEIEKLK